MLSRRSFLKNSALGMAATGSMNLQAAQTKLGQTHHKAKAKTVIFLFMAGGQSQLDLFLVTQSRCHLQDWLRTIKFHFLSLSIQYKSSVGICFVPNEPKVVTN